MSMTRAKRWRVRYPVQVASQDFIDETETVNVSLRGLSVETTQSMRVGSQLYVRLLLPDRTSSVDYEICTVQWAADGRIGLETSEMRTTEEHRLHRHLTALSDFGNLSTQVTPSKPAGHPLGRTSEVRGLWDRFMKPLLATTRGAQRFASSTQKHPAR